MAALRHHAAAARPHRGIAGLVVAALASVLLALAAPGAGVARAAEGDGARFVAVAPGRLADTRVACTCTQLDGSTIRVQVAGVGGVPPEAIAAALTITVTQTAAAGFATVWPSDTPRQETSTVNWAPGQTRANGTIVQLGASGSVDVYLDGGLGAAKVIVDVTGGFVPWDGASGAGAFRSIAPVRALDTRGAGAPIGAGSTISVGLPAGVPADATAIAVNVTATQSAQGGYLTAYAAGTPQPPTSTVNTDGPDQTRAATAIVPVTAAGILIYTSDTTHVLVDVTGWFTSDATAATGEGLFVPVGPTRVFDTRGLGLLPGGSTVDMKAAATDPAFVDGVTGGANALVFNTTVAGSSEGGFVTTYASGTPQPGTSSVNWSAGETVANLTISPTSAYSVSFFTSATTHVIVDLTGYFTGTPVDAGGPTAPTYPEPEPEPTPEPPPPTPTNPEQNAQAAAIIQASVPPAIWNVLGDVAMNFDLDNDSCYGTVGLTTTTLTSFGGPWMVSKQEVSLSPGFLTSCPGTPVPYSTAAHEIGHVIIVRWETEPATVAEQDARTNQIESLSPGGEECMAESIGQVFFQMIGRDDYSVGYGGGFQSCAAAPSTVTLANEIINAAID